MSIAAGRLQRDDTDSCKVPPRHRLPSNKFLLYDHSIKIPMVVMGPGIRATPRGLEVSRVISALRLIPFLLLGVLFS